MTGCHRGLKRKLWAGYRAPSLKRTSCCDAFSSTSVVSYAFSMLCVYSTFGHHPHLLGYLCAKICFFCSPHCWASQWRKIVYSLTHSITHSPSLFDAPGKLWNIVQLQISVTIDNLSFTFTQNIAHWLYDNTHTVFSYNRINTLYNIYVTSIQWAMRLSWPENAYLCPPGFVRQFLPKWGFISRSV